MTNLNDISSGVYARLGTANIPSEITSGDIIDLANDRIIYMENFTGLSVNSGDIPRSFISPLKDLTTADVIARKIRINVGEDISIGNIRLEYTNTMEAEREQAKYYLARAQENLKMLGKHSHYDYTTNVD